MVTGRQEPRLVLVSLTCEGSQLCLNAPDMEELRFPLYQPDKPIFKCRYLKCCFFNLISLFLFLMQMGEIIIRSSVNIMKHYIGKIDTSP